jgi:predicted glycogen debranching enzyme
MQQLLPNRPVRIARSDSPDPYLDREWLLTNGMGGYASGTIANIPTRRYHGLLVAALHAPLGRTMMLHQVIEDVMLPSGRILRLGGVESLDSPISLDVLQHLSEFRLEGGLPTWTFDLEDICLQKQIVMLHEQNTVHVHYRVLAGNGPAQLRLPLFLQPRGHDQNADPAPPMPWAVHADAERFELIPPENVPFPPLRLQLHGDSRAFTLAPQELQGVLYRTELRRGYPAVGASWSPGWLGAIIAPDRPVTLVASTEPWDTVLALSPTEALDSTRKRAEQLLATARTVTPPGPVDELILAADQFIITPVGRAEERERARAAGDTVRTMIAGYHWFTDWGRDTMISLEGLTLVTGRRGDAAYILKTFAHYVREGLIPNLFPEGRREGLYHTADATLWFFHALDRYLHYADGREILQLLLPTLVQIYHAHLRGTAFGIGVDAADGLLRQGAEGYQLTWMDAKVGDWVVTPRRGKAVEINALWYNALRLLEGWLRDDHQNELALQISNLAAQAHRSFNEKFWNSPAEGLFDVIDGPNGNDPSCRPNQIFAFSLRHPVLQRDRWDAVLKVVAERLLTPVGLRSLAANHQDYKPQYFGDLRARDAAYHQGTIWAWLIGPFIDAWLRVHPDEPEAARALLRGFEQHLNEGCVGSISEIFDGEAPYSPRGCVAQAWSVAEVFRAYSRTA